MYEAKETVSTAKWSSLMSDRKYTGPIIEMHIHAHTRSTDDLRALKEVGTVAIVEPAFWSGVDNF